MVNNDFFIIIYTLLVAFCGATCKEINDKTHDNTESFRIFFGEIMLHGFSGWLVGLYSIKYVNNDLITITIFSGLGGLFGFALVKKVYMRIFPSNDTNSKEDKDNGEDNNDKIDDG